MKAPNLLQSPLSHCLIAILLAASALFFFWGGLSNLFSRWSFQPEYSHGFLIPLISLYILWESRNDWLPSFGQGSYWGVALCLFAFLIAMAGEVSALFLLIHYAFILFLVGVSVCLMGRGVKKIWAPIALLVFAVPLPYVIEVVLTAKLQLISSSFGVALIRLFDIPVHLSGNVIDMGAMQLHVVEACSGLRYLFPLASLGVVVAYFYRGRLWKKLVVVISTIPITIVLNSIRIGITGIIVDRYGQSHAQGFLHDFEGWVVFVICLMVLTLEIMLIEQLTTKNNLLSAFAPAKKDVFTFSYQANSANIHSLLLVLCLSLAANGLLQHVDTQREVIPESVSLASFPMELGPWQGVRQPIRDDVSVALQYTDAIMADYIHKADLDIGINFYMAYYESQRKGVSPHSPKVCIPGGGWEISDFDRIDLKGMPVNRSVIRKGRQAQLVYYWFVERGTVVANEYKKKWGLFRDAVRYGRSDGALVRVVAPISQETEMQEIEQRMQDFIKNIHPKVLAYLPSKIQGDAL